MDISKFAKHTRITISCYHKTLQDENQHFMKTVVGEACDITPFVLRSVSPFVFVFVFVSVSEFVFVFVSVFVFAFVF